MGVRKYLRPGLDDLEPYESVRPLDVLSAETGIPVDDIAKLDANENVYGPLPAIRDAVASAAMHIYPDPAQAELRAAIAEYADVAPDMVVAGAGSDELLDMVLRAVATPRIVTAPPTFGMYRFLAQIAGLEVVEVMRGNGFALDVPGIGGAVAQGAKVVFIASPNNPTGDLCPTDTIRALCEMETLVVVDEAYSEFAGETCARLLPECENLVVLRTFSKWAALAGLRVGYALCHPRLQAVLMSMKQPYNVNAAADVAARVAIQRRDEVMASVRALVVERDAMFRRLAQFEWLVPQPSRANFLLVRVCGRDVGELAARLRKRGVLVRTYSRPELSGYIRVSAGRPKDTDRLVNALREVV